MLDFFSQKNRILLREMVKTDFKLRYQGSLIGHLWSILKPLMLFTIMYLVFVRFLRFDDGTPHYAIGLLIGMVTWSFFSEATSMGMMSIVSRGDLLRKLNFSKEIIVISSVVPNINENFTRLGKKYFNINPMFVTLDNVENEIKILPNMERGLGADRIVDILAAKKLYPEKELLIIDFGTATTFDMIKDSTYMPMTIT